MSHEIYKYVIADAAHIDDIEDSLMLAVLTTESVFGRARVRLDASFSFDKAKLVCEIDAGNEVGCHLAKVFTGFLEQEFGEDAFRVSRKTKGVDIVDSPDAGRKAEV